MTATALFGVRFRFGGSANRRPFDQLPLLISTLSEHRLGRNLQWQALGFALAFLALGALTSWLFGSRFGL